MNNKYDKVMENIEVTTEMHDRIVNNINQLDFSKKPSKVTSIFNYKKYITIAACFIVLLVGTFIIYNMPKPTHEPPQQVVPDIAECSSLGALSKAVGFKVCEVKKVPFDIESVQYTSFWKELAQVKYVGSKNTVVFRMSAGTEDVSGDYNTYSDVKNCQIGKYTVTLKGEKALYNLAIWKSNGMSYSISIENGVSETEIRGIIKSVK